MANRTPSKFKNICVFCSSDMGNNPNFKRAAIELGRELAAGSIGLIYGGGNLGLKGAIATSVAGNRSRVFGVIPYQHMNEIGIMIGKVQMVSDTNYQRMEMARQADAFIALPGGFETLEELIGVITGAHLDLHRKPIGLLNVDGYYDHLLSFVEKAVYEGLVPIDAPSFIITGETPLELLTKMEASVEMRDVETERLGIRSMDPPPTPYAFADFKIKFALHISEAETFEALKKVTHHYSDCIKLHDYTMKNERKQLLAALAATEEPAPPEPEIHQTTSGPAIYRARRKRGTGEASTSSK